MVLRCGRPNGAGDHEADLHVFLHPSDEPGLIDHRRGGLLAYVQAVPPDNAGIGSATFGTWHWPERVNSDEPNPTR
jgi:hypothetical protein